MEFYVELKLAGDAYPDGFANGMILSKAQSSRALKLEEETDTVKTFRNYYNHKLCLHQTKRGEATEYYTCFINEGDGDATLEMISSVAIRNVKADKIYRMQSFWSAEGKLKCETITDLHLEPSWNRCATRVEKFGTCGSMPVRKYFPFLVLEDSENGDFVGIQLYAPSSWQIELLVRESDNLTVTGGLADYDFGHWCKTIAKGEEFVTPRALVATGKSIYEVCDKLVKAQTPNVSPVDNDMGILFNEYCTTWGNPSFENLKRISDKLKGKGIKYLVIDSGWYGKNEGWWAAMGDWDVNEEKFPGGLKATADYIKSCGMIPGLWYELESVGTSSYHFESHEHLLKRNGKVLTVGGRRFWDMEDPWVVDYLTKKVINQLRDSGFGYLKIDYNDTIGIGCDGYESLGEGLRNKVIASAEFIKKIGAEVDNIVIENCSSGGHRLEPAMMEIASQASFSDAHETKIMPVIAANLHRVIPPQQTQIWAVIRKSDDADRIHYSIINTFFGRMCLSGDIYELSDEQWSLIDEGIAFYNKASDIIKDGMTVLCESDPVSYNKPTGNQILIRKLGNRELVIAHRFAQSKDIDESFLAGKKVIAEYGKADNDFSAKAWILEE